MTLPTATPTWLVEGTAAQFLTSMRSAVEQGSASSVSGISFSRRNRESHMSFFRIVSARIRTIERRFEVLSSIYLSLGTMPQHPLCIN